MIEKSLKLKSRAEGSDKNGQVNYTEEQIGLQGIVQSMSDFKYDKDVSQYTEMKKIYITNHMNADVKLEDIIIYNDNEFTVMNVKVDFNYNNTKKVIELDVAR